MRPVANAMITAPILDAETTVQDGSAAMLDAHVEVAVVVGGRRVRGILTAADVAEAMAAGREVGSTPVMAVSNRDPEIVRAREPLAEARARMKAAGVLLAVVVDENRRPVGVLADHGATT